MSNPSSRPDPGQASLSTSEPLRPFERAARLMHYRSPKQAKDRSYQIPVEIIQFRSAFRDQPGLLAHFTGLLARKADREARA